MFLSSAHGIISRMDHKLWCKTSLNKFKNTEIMQSIFSDHNGMKLEMNNKRKTRKLTNMWEINHQWVKEEITREV